MASITLSDPVQNTLSDANLIASNNAALRTLLNGGIDSTNISSVNPSLLVGYPNDSTQELRGDGTWATATAFLPGMITEYGGTSAPSGWLLCDGTAVSRTIYAGLFAIISTHYGTGDGSTTFNLPDYRGRVGVGYAASGGHTDVSTIGNNDGVAVANRRPKHNSTVTDPGHSHNIAYNSGASANGTVALSGRDSVAGNTFTPGTASATTGVTVGPGGTAAVDTPAYLVSNRIIKT